MKGPMTTQTLRGMRNAAPCTGAAIAPRLLRQRSVRSQAVVQQLHRGVRRVDRPRRPAERGRHAALHRLPAGSAAAAESGAQARQLAERGAATRARFLFRPASVRRHRDSHAGGIIRANGVHLRGLPSPRSAYGLLRHRWPGELRRHAADREDPAPAQHVSPRWACSARPVHFFGAPDTGNIGDQIRGFGFVHDGSMDTLFRFFTAVVFEPTLKSGFPILNPEPPVATWSSSCSRSTATWRRSSASRSR